MIQGVQKLQLRGYFQSRLFVFFLYFSLNFFLEDKLGSRKSHDASQINPRHKVQLIICHMTFLPRCYVKLRNVISRLPHYL